MALDDGHLQVVHEVLIKQLYKTCMGCLCGVGEGVKCAQDLVSVGKFGQCELHDGSILLAKLIIVKCMVGIMPTCAV